MGEWCISLCCTQTPAHQLQAEREEKGGRTNSLRSLRHTQTKLQHIYRQLACILCLFIYFENVLICFMYALLPSALVFRHRKEEKECCFRSHRLHIVFGSFCLKSTLTFCLTISNLHKNAMAQNLNIYNDCCEILPSYTKRFSRYIFWNNLPLTRVHAIFVARWNVQSY